MSKKVVLLDRDGTLNVKAPGHGYIYQIETFEFIPGVVPALSSLADDGFQFAVVTNQAGVEKGLYTKQDVDTLHQYMCRELAKSGIDVLHVEYCPHWQEPCDCRKPKPGMLLSTANQLDVEPGLVVYVGDDPRDMVAASNAGMQSIMLGKPEACQTADSQPTLGFYDDLASAQNAIRSWYNAL